MKGLGGRFKGRDLLIAALHIAPGHGDQIAGRVQPRVDIGVNALAAAIFSVIKKLFRRGALGAQPAASAGENGDEHHHQRDKASQNSVFTKAHGVSSLEISS